MALNGIEFTGYWDAAANRVLGKVGVRLFDTPRQRVQLYKVAVGGFTALGNSNIWFEGDLAFYTGFEWMKILGPLGTTAEIIKIIANLPTSPVASGTGLWNDGGLLAISGEVDYSQVPGSGVVPPVTNRDVLEVPAEPTAEDISPNTFRAVRNIQTGRTSFYTNVNGVVVDLLTFGV